MAKTYGDEYPERALMGVISDLLGIRHFTTSRGGTVRKDFLEAVAEALGEAPATLQGMGKDDVLGRAVEAATRRPMDPTLFSPGATVTNEALQAIVDGIIEHGVAGRPPVRGIELTEMDGDEDDLDIDLSAFNDLRDRRLMLMVTRQGQNRFRTGLIEAYGGRCAVTGFDASESLEAAHIFPYLGQASNRITNGLLLRADIHTLYDRGAIAVHETTKQILVKEHLAPTAYGELAERKLRLPREKRNYPAVPALRSHREWAGL